jgi:peptidoglycan/LPS O-acetylase OafA/YrhL
MFGSLRFILATLVLYSHLGFRIAGYNTGVFAVVIFYMLAGYVMTGLITTYYNKMERVFAFYEDRLLRILPQYFFFMLLAVILWCFGANSLFISKEPHLSDWFSNITIIPLNFYMFSGADSFTLIPPAWSLGAELQFYFLFPFLLLTRLYVRIIAFYASILIFFLAQATIINPDWFGYRLLPGILFIFMSGSLIYEVSKSKQKIYNFLIHCRYVPLFIIWSCLIFWFFILFYNSELAKPYLIEVSLGYVLGLPVVVFLSRLKRNNLDDILGRLSFGVFLSHFLALWTLNFFRNGAINNECDTYTLIEVFALSVMLAIIGTYFVEKPFFIIRKKIQKR